MRRARATSSRPCACCRGSRRATSSARSATSCGKATVRSGAPSGTCSATTSADYGCPANRPARIGTTIRSESSGTMKTNCILRKRRLQDPQRRFRFSRLSIVNRRQGWYGPPTTILRPAGKSPRFRATIGKRFSYNFKARPVSSAVTKYPERRYARFPGNIRTGCPISCFWIRNRPSCGLTDSKPTACSGETARISPASSTTSVGRRTERSGCWNSSKPFRSKISAMSISWKPRAAKSWSR